MDEIFMYKNAPHIASSVFFHCLLYREHIKFLVRQNCASLFLEKRNDAHNEDHDKQEGEHIGHIPTHPILYLRSFSGVGLCQEIFPTPSSFADGKEQEDKGTDGKNEVAHQKILQVQECAGPTHGMDAG